MVAPPLIGTCRSHWACCTPHSQSVRMWSSERFPTVRISAELSSLAYASTKAPVENRPTRSLRRFRQRQQDRSCKTRLWSGTLWTPPT
jgi:hypothetical protein